MKVKVWIYASWNKYSNVHTYSIFSYEADKYSPEYQLIGETEVYFEEPAFTELMNGTVAALRKERATILGDAQAKATKIEAQINDLLALEFKPLAEQA